MHVFIPMDISDIWVQGQSRDNQLNLLLLVFRYGAPREFFESFESWVVVKGPSTIHGKYELSRAWKWSVRIRFIIPL